MPKCPNGASNTYLFGEKCLNPDYYLTGEDYGDNENSYTGFNNDSYRLVAADSTTGTAIPPRRDQPGPQGYLDCGVFGSAHSGICQFVFCDGSTHAISFSIDPETHRCLGNRRDGMVIDRGQF